MSGTDETYRSGYCSLEEAIKDLLWEYDRARRDFDCPESERSVKLLGGIDSPAKPVGHE